MLITTICSILMYIHKSTYCSHFILMQFLFFLYTWCIHFGALSFEGYFKSDFWPYKLIILTIINSFPQNFITFLNWYSFILYVNIISILQCVTRLHRVDMALTLFWSTCHPSLVVYSAVTPIPILPALVTELTLRVDPTGLPALAVFSAVAPS